MEDSPIMALVKKVPTLSYSDNEYFISFLKKYKFNMFRLAKSILHNDADAEDAVSESILKAYQNLNTLRSFDSLKPWIMKILINESYAAVKRLKRVELFENMELLAGNSEDNTSELWPLVSTLEYEFRTVVILFYYEDMSIKDISKVLGISSGTVKSRLSRARQKLKNVLEREGR